MPFTHRLKQFIVVIGDIASFIIGFIASLAVRNLSVPSWYHIEKHATLFVVVFFLWIVLNYINGLYDLDTPADRKFTRRFIETSAIALMIGIIFFYTVPERKITPKTILALNVFIGYGLSYLWRLLYHVIIGTKKLQVRVLLLGWSPETKEILAITRAHPEKCYTIVSIIDPTSALKAEDAPHVDVYHNLKALRPAITTHKVQLVAVASHIHNAEDTLTELYQLLFWPVKITDITSFYESLMGKIPPSTFSESWFLKNLAHKDQPVYDKMRGIIDYFAACILGILFTAVFPIIALIIKITSGGPIFYTQKRIGQYGELFTIYKFRTMYVSTLDGSADPKGHLFTERDDKRVTPFGKFLRKSRLDELPQLINLFKQNLTLIGPRPERPEIVEKLIERMPYYSLRHIVKPGITGWAVINQQYTDTIETSLQKLQYDLFYIKNRSLILDLSILLRTVNVVIRFMGQ